MEENQRHLSFNKFIQERSIQISKFLNDLEMDTKKKGHQALPRSIRRRAMSHNRFRVPRKMRKNMEDDLAKAQTMQKIPKCRKHIRKRRHLITAYKLRSSKAQWLSTHLWSARRMRMMQYHGYKIALTANNKCFRSAYRHFRHNCCLLDLSYYNCLSIQLQQEILPQLVRLKSTDILPKLDRIYQVDIFSSNTRQKLICPAFLIRCFNNNNQYKVKIFFHPAAREEISKLNFQTKCNAILEQGQCDMYILIGPESTNVLTSALRQYGIITKTQTINSEFYEASNKLVYLSKDDSFQIVNKPQVDCPVLLQRQLKKQYNTQENINLRQNMFKIYQHLKKQRTAQTSSPSNKSHDLFWEYYNKGQNKQLQQTTFKVTLRSRYTHKRKNKISKQQKKKIIQIQKQSPVQKKRKKDNEMRDESEISESLNFSKQIYLQTPIHKTAVLQQIHPIMIGSVGQGMMKGHLLFSSNAHSCKFWRILSHCHLKVIGRREYAHMHLENKTLLFPQNYAQTHSFAKYSLEMRQNLFKKYLRLPLQRRPRYFSINSPNPFGYLPSKPLIISLEMVGKGKCFQMSYICEVLQADLKQISQQLQDGKVGIIATQPKQQSNPSELRRYKTIDELSSDLNLTNPHRRIIGNITTGGFLFSRSRQGGIGFIDTARMTEGYLQKLGGYVFVRKASSRHYMLAAITNKCN